MSRSKKGFTIVELVIVIAVVAILAAVLIPSFSSLNKKAKDSAYLQERTNQQIADLAEKVENQDYLSWADLEAKLAEELAKLEIPEGADTEELKKAMSDATANALEEYNKAYGNKETGLTEAQVKAIIEKALEGQLTTAQVEAIVKTAVGDQLDADDIKTIVDTAVAGLDKETGITAAEMEAAIKDALASKPSVNTDDVKTAVEKALANFGHGNDISASQIKDIITNAVANANPGSSDELAAKQMSAILATNFATPSNELAAVVEKLKANGYNVNNKFAPHTTGTLFYWHKGTNDVVVAPEGTLGTEYVDLRDGASLIKVEAATISDVLAALEDGNDVTLTADVALTEAVALPSGNIVIDLAGHKFDASAVNGRPFELKKNTTLTINAEGSTVNCGEYGLVNVTAGAQDVNVVINGGTFTGELNWGAFIKVRGGAEAKVTLNNVTYTDSSDDSYIVNSDGAKNTEVVINGGSYTSALGIQAKTVTLEGATIVTDAYALAVHGTFAVNNCTITSNGKYEKDITGNGSAPAACVSVSSNGVGTVTNSNLTYVKYDSANSQGAAVLVLSSGGKITVDSATTITGEKYVNTVNGLYNGQSKTAAYIEIGGIVMVDVEYKK